MTTEGLSILEAVVTAFNPIFMMFSVQNVVGVLTVIVSTTIALPFMWWGLRKAVSSLMAAFRKGKVSL